MAKKDKVIYGCTEPRIFTPPLRKLTEKTSLGFACIQYAKEILHIELYPWQEWVLIHAMEIVGDLKKQWHFRFRTIVILVARQSGKTVLSAVIASFFLNVLQIKSMLGTSLSVERAIETLKLTIDYQESCKALQQEIQHISHANGNQKMTLKGDRSYKAEGPTRRAGRGSSNALILIDELREHRTWDAWSASVASTNAVPNAVVICFSNAGDPDSIVLRSIRSQAISEIEHDESKKQDFGGESVENIGLFEWSAEDDADTKDVKALAQANPALGYGKLTLRALLANEKTMPENRFRSECLCQTVDTLLQSPFPKGTWDELLDDTSEIAPESEIYYGIDMSADRRVVSIAACGQREDGNYHIELITKRNGSSWAIDWFRERSIKSKMKLAFQGRGAPVCGLAEEICTLTGIERCAIEGPALTDGWARFYDAVANEDGIKVYHLDQPALDHVAKIMQLKFFGNGTSLPDRVKSPDDISPLFACIMAFAAATQLKQEKEKKVYESVYSDQYTLTFI